MRDNQARGRGDSFRSVPPPPLSSQKKSVLPRGNLPHFILFGMRQICGITSDIRRQTMDISLHMTEPLFCEATEETAGPERRPLGLALRRGLMLRCPACGEGKLFRK